MAYFILVEAMIVAVYYMGLSRRTGMLAQVKQIARK